jgi:hypothetical protein
MNPHQLLRLCLIATLGLGLLSACSSAPSAPQFADIRFNDQPALKLDASAIQVQEDFKPAGKAPSVDYLFPVTPLHAIESWAHDRLAPAGSASQAVFTILDASVVEVDLPRKTGFFATTFTTQESERYDMKLIARLDLIDARGLVVRTVGVTSLRSQSITDSTSPNKRDQIWYDMLKTAMADFNKQMESEIRQNFGAYLVP